MSVYAYIFSVNCLPNLYCYQFSLDRYNSIAVYPNNSVIDINLVEEGFKGYQITNGDTTCCHSRATDRTGRGEWYFPNGTFVPNPGDGIFYRTRDHMVIRLNYGDIHNTEPTPPGLYKCEIPVVGGSIIGAIK